MPLEANNSEQPAATTDATTEHLIEPAVEAINTAVNSDKAPEIETNPAIASVESLPINHLDNAIIPMTKNCIEIENLQNHTFFLRETICQLYMIVSFYNVKLSPRISEARSKVRTSSLYRSKVTNIVCPI